MDAAMLGRRRPLAAATAVMLTLMLGACGTVAGDAEAASAPQVASTTLTGTQPGSGAHAAEPEALFTETSDVVYMTVGDRDVTLDIYTPTSEGPWPVVVAFHGLGTKDDDHNTVIAEAAAAQGMLVFTPTWIDGHSFPVTAGSFDLWRDEASCSVAFAQEHARLNGGDPSRTVLYGFSAGIGPPLFASLQPIMEPIAGCAANAAPTAVAGVVVGDGEYLLHSPNFDEAFAIDSRALRRELAKMIDPRLWSPDLRADFHLWVAENSSSARSIGDPESGWFAQRDPEGSIRADLERLGQLEDGVVGYIDGGKLLEDRLTGAGVEATLDTYPGGHTTLDKVSELVGYLQLAASG